MYMNIFTLCNSPNVIIRNISDTCEAQLFIEPQNVSFFCDMVKHKNFYNVFKK